MRELWRERIEGTGQLQDLERGVVQVGIAARLADDRLIQGTIGGNPDLDDTIARLHAYQEAGADVLYAPGTTTRAQLEAIVRSVDRPVNYVAGLAGVPLTLQELAAIGVRRVSLGSTLARAALGTFLRVVAEMKEHGSFTFNENAIAYSDISAMLDA